MQNRPLRILVTAFGAVPGSNSHTAALVGMAAAIRGDLDMVTVKTEGLAHMERFGDARMFRVPLLGTGEEQRATFGRAVWRQLEAEPYDVVHVRGPVEGQVVAEQRGNFGFRMIYEVATYPDEAEGPGAEVSWGDLHRRCLDAADLVLVPTEAAARSLGEAGFAGKVAVVAPGVDVNAFDWWPAARDDTVRLLYLGNFSADRDLHTVLGAIRDVRRHIPVQALLAGDPDQERRYRLRKLVEAFELSDVIACRTEPRARKLPVVIAACNIGIVPASATPRFQESGDLPQPLLEYLACRRPVVAAGVPGIAEVVRDEKEGLLYVPGDEGTLAEAITTLAAKQTLADRLVETAYDRVRWQFSAAARRRRIAEVYEMLVPGSQSYDVWNEAFDHEITGETPSSLFDGTSNPPADTTEMGVGDARPPSLSDLPTDPPEELITDPPEPLGLGPVRISDTRPQIEAPDILARTPTPLQTRDADTLPGVPREPDTGEVDLP